MTVLIERKKPYTLVLALDEPNRKVLLGMKKRGFGSNKYNGFGGKLEPGETVEQAAHREMLEESAVYVNDMQKVGINLFTFENNPVAMEVHIYRTTSFSGTPTETEEMRPEWFSYDEIPYDQMWLDDRYWLPLLLQSRCFIGEYHFSQDHKSVLAEKLSIVSEAPDEFDLSQCTL
ncbi:Nudix (Nucleoside diphosphate linked moiety X)-type motif 1 [Apophysomyces sp. BC1034]|nr:Nudix (Nucleoside diphosphate linked moiety X)-type motif 1 [Apophysomyces sp. BC1015]KAG0183016.1 Nudix (Nucleoside diphosphate linked moiety X)-type motif 1 [Apophysomyces sp. BC1021]KAG0194749.1 Nudix (Nucleoside diphosphate linked moiety X)-type motif 1 [Apophysomyces sp. BC1034]